MRKRQASWLAALACLVAVSGGCSTRSEPPSGDTQSRQERERSNQPDGMTRGGGGGY
jgi:hypothetical protein